MDITGVLPFDKSSDTGDISGHIQPQTLSATLALVQEPGSPRSEQCKQQRIRRCIRGSGTAVPRSIERSPPV